MLFVVYILPFLIKTHTSIEMILYGFLFLYFLLLIFSLIFFLVKKFNGHSIQYSLAIPQKGSNKYLLWKKVKISRLITQYECPECGLKSMEKLEECPHCEVQDNKVPLVAHTIPFLG